MTSKRNFAEQIVSTIRSHGYDGYFAGGCVRDLLLGIPPKDFDIVTNALPEKIQEIFHRTASVGKVFGVILVFKGGHSFEVATFRSDGRYSDCRHPDSVTFGSMEEDARRRDITINGMYLDPHKDTLIDLVDGRSDLDRKIIRAIGDPIARFSEDALRMLRVIRFAARFDFSVDAETIAAIKTFSANISLVSMERIAEELQKMLTGPLPAKALDLLDHSLLLDLLLPEISVLKKIEQPVQFHPEGNVFTHIRLMLQLLDKPSPSLAWGVLLHDVGKSVTIEVRDRIHFPNHAKVGSEIALRIAERMKFSNELRDRVIALIANHDRFFQVEKMKLSTLKRFLAQENFDELIELHRLDRLSSDRSLTIYDYCAQIRQTLGKARLNPPPLLNGHDLIAIGIPEGPKLGSILEQIRVAQLEESISTREEANSLAIRLLEGVNKGSGSA